MPEPFTFGIPLIARASSPNWPLVEALLELTLASVRAQTQGDFRVVVAGHDCPRAILHDKRLTFIRAEWPAEPTRSDNLDSGRKKHLINAHVLRQGGGFLMFLDADDWVDTRLIAAARVAIGPDHVGGLIRRGYATDLLALRAAPIPHPEIFAGEFHRVCGSSTVARLEPTNANPYRRDPFSIMHEHYRWPELASEHGLSVAHLPVAGNYVVNTGVNHSERDGPFAHWRRCFSDGVRREGTAADDTFLARFGLSVERLQRPLPDGAPRIVARGEREDGAGDPVEPGTGTPRERK